MAQAVGPASDPKSVQMGYVVDTEAPRRFVRVVGGFFVSPVLYRHPFRLSVTDAVWSWREAS